MKTLVAPEMTDVELALLAEAQRLTDIPIVRVRVREEEDYDGSNMLFVWIGVEDDYVITDEVLDKLTDMKPAFRQMIYDTLKPNGFVAIAFAFNKTLAA